MNRETGKRRKGQGLCAASTVALVLLTGCSGGSGAGAAAVSSNGSSGGSVAVGGSSSGSSGASVSTASFAVGADPSIPNFSGASEDQSFIASASASVGVSLATPSCSTTIYVAPPANYTAAGTGQLGSGTQANPYQNLIAVVANATPGDCIYLEPGTYLMYSMAQKFGEPQSGLFPNNSGTQANPIVITTDPARLSWSGKVVATLDWQMQTSAPSGTRAMAFSPQDYWVIENLEMKDALNRIFWVAGSHDLIYHNDLHHVALTGEDNVGIVGIMRRTGGDYNDFIIGNNIHDLAVYDANGNPTAYYNGDSANVGCTYSENDQFYTSNTYASGFPANGNSLTIAQLASYTTPPDSNVYFYGNAVHNCMRGIANKEPVVGPWYMLSNVIYNVQTGIKMPVSGTPASPTLIRNNIIYNAGNQQLQTGIQFGISNTNRFLGNADNMTVTNNTVIDAASEATLLYGGFNDVVDNNVFVTTGSGVAHRVLPGGYTDGGTNTSGQTWFNGGAWPNAVGEYLFSVNASNPYYYAMPNFLQQEAGTYNAISFNDNLYTSTPTVTLNATPSVGPDLNGTDIDQNPQVLSWSSLSQLFRDASSDDYRAGTSPGVLATIGSQIP